MAIALKVMATMVMMIQEAALRTHFLSTDVFEGPSSF